MAGALFWPVGMPCDLGLYLSDRVLENKLLSRDDRLVERWIDCFQFIHESVSATVVEGPAILSVPQADDSLRDQWVIVCHRSIRFQYKRQSIGRLPFSWCAQCMRILPWLGVSSWTCPAA